MITSIGKQIFKVIIDGWSIAETKFMFRSRLFEYCVHELTMSFYCTLQSLSIEPLYLDKLNSISCNLFL